MRKDNIEIEDYGKGVCINERGNTIHLDLAYPRINKIKYIEIGISDVRASDGIRISYDFERDGYIIEQPFIVEIDKKDYIDCVTNWKEVAFLRSWVLENMNMEVKKNAK